MPADSSRSRRARKRAATLLLTLALAPAVTALTPGSASAAGDALGAGGTLTAGQCLASGAGGYQLCVQTDGNLVAYAPGRPTWTAVTSGPGVRLVNQTDGNLVLYSAGGSPLWNSGTAGAGASTLMVQSDGNVVLYSGRGPSWNTYTSGGTSRLASSTAVAYAKRALGRPYVYGAAGPTSFDCSGLVMAAYASAGVRLPHSAAGMYGYGVPVSTAGLVPGDLAFSYSGPGHVGIYIGNGVIIDSPHTGATVRQDPVSMYGAYVGSRRIA